MKRLIIFAMLIISPILSATDNDLEIFDNGNAKSKSYIGIMPPKVKTIACISPGSYPGSKIHRQGLEILRKAGYKVKVMPHAFVKEEGKNHAPVEGKVADFYAAWNDPEVDMILCIRGGMGSEQLLDNLDWTKLKNRPELYIQGYSDATLVVCALLAQKNGHPIAGTMVGSLSGLTPSAINAIKKINSGEQLGPINVETLIPGDCRGLPLGGSLWKLCRLVEKSYCPDTAGKIVFIEASNVKPENVREKLQYLIDKKFFAKASGVVFGQFAQCKPKAQLQKILKEMAPKFGVPVFNGYPFGHIPHSHNIDFLREVVIENGTIVFPAVKK